MTLISYEPKSVINPIKLTASGIDNEIGMRTHRDLVGIHQWADPEAVPFFGSARTSYNDGLYGNTTGKALTPVPYLASTNTRDSSHDDRVLHVPLGYEGWIC